MNIGGTQGPHKGGGRGGMGRRIPEGGDRDQIIPEGARSRSKDTGGGS